MSCAPDGEGRARAVAFLRSLQDACAQRLAPVPGGHAVLDPRHPRLWDANHLRVESGEAPDADALIDAAEQQLGALDFRSITVLDEAIGQALAPPLQAAGYRPVHELLMLLGDGPPPRPDPTIAVAEVPPALIAPSRRAAAVELGVGDDEVGRQLASRDVLIAAATATRCFAVLAEDGTPAARCVLYGDGTVAQVEDVYTAPTHRSRGYARALVSHAARAARDDGAELVFLVADADDTPQQLYRRLGFADAGLLPRFRRTL